MIDDDLVDVKAFQRSLRKREILNTVQVASNGIEALAMLRGEPGHEAVIAPYIILLDINMPKMNGLEFLAELRQDPKLHMSIVFVLTTSDTDKDKLSAYGNHVAGYIIKSSMGTDFNNLIDMLQPYWRIVDLPNSSSL